MMDFQDWTFKKVYVNNTSFKYTNIPKNSTTSLTMKCVNKYEQ